MPFFSDQLFSKPTSTVDPKRGRLMLETLEKRQLLAADVEMFSTSGVDDHNTTSPSTLQASGQAEGELVNDLVQFAKNLAAREGVTFFGADWCPACNQQKELFQDGARFLPFVEVTGPDRTLNTTGISEGITEFPTWEFPDGSRLSGVVPLATLSARSGVPIPQGERPSFVAVGNRTVQIGSPLHIPIDAYDPDGGPLTVTITSSNPELVQGTVLTGNRSIRIDMETYGDMVLELFEQRAPRATGRVIELANSGFYDGIIFHRVVNEFVIQAGDPTGTGTSGSTLGNFDDEFHPDLQHNRSGVLSFAKAGDDTNNSQFFITEVPTRFLDFNHSIFGQLVEGDDVREAISNHQTSSNGQPTTPIRIESIDVFDDTENAVIMLKPTGNTTGSTTMTITVRDQDGNEFSETIQVNVVADTDDSQPFLNPITVPTSFSNTSPAQIQLSSIDIEGDPVSYTATQQTSLQDATVAINANTGLLTVTPDAGFVGSVDVLVGVQRRVSDGSGDFDSQRITLNFAATSSAPTGLDLLATSDTGASNSDNITNANSLTFSVSGVTSGATVEIVNQASGSVVGTGIATGSSITITTTNIAALGDGTYQLAARQRVNGQTSTLSPPITLVYDTTAPASVIASAATQANVGTLFETNLISPEEGNGLRYALTTRPTSATIDATTGLITWTPTSSQLGANTFTVSITDTAGNTRTESFNVQVAGTPLAGIRLQIVNASGNELSSVNVGDQFFLRMYGTDRRGGINTRGIFAAFADILFDSNLVRVVPGSTINYDAAFPIQRNGVASNGLIDELGAATDRLTPSDLQESLIATVRLEALASGSVNIRSEPAEATSSEVLLYGNDEQIPASSVAYGSVSLAIGQSFTVANDSFTVIEDSSATTLNVLANDRVVVGTGSLSVVSVTQPSVGGTVALSSGVVSFTPAANFVGTSTFTYRVSDSNGVQESASVTVTVTSVNDPPTATNDTFTVNAGSSSNTLNVLANDSIEPDTGETLSIVSVNSTSSGVSVTVSSDRRSVVYTPAAGFIGTDTFSYTISDGALTATAQVMVTVVSPDNPPTANNDSFTVVEDAAEAVFNVTSNDTRDIDNQTFVLNSVGVPNQNGTARISSDGSQFFYRPAANFAGTELVTYTIRDTGGGLSSATVTFTVTPVNDPPPAGNLTKNVSQGAGETTVLLISELPPNVDAGETITFTNVTTPTAGGTARIATGNGSILYTPPSATFTGTDTLTFTVADGSGLTSTGTLTLTVANLTRRDVMLDFGSPNVLFSRVALVGSDSLGNSVNVPLEYLSTTAADQLAVFSDVLPGQYSIEIPAVPFFENGDQAQTFAFTSAPEEGNRTIDADLGSLKPEFIDIRDFLGSTPRKSMLVAIQPGSVQTLAIPTTATDTIRNPRAELDATGANLTIRGTNSTGGNVQATIPTSDQNRVQLRGVEDGLRLLKVSLESSDVTFTTVTPTTSTAEGEQAAAVASSTSTLTVGDVAAEGESLAASSVTRADVFVPSTATANERSSSVVLPLDAGDLWSEDTPDSQPVDAPESTATASVDDAMKDVSPRLRLIASGGETVAESTGDTGIDQSAVDAVLTAEMRI